MRSVCEIVVKAQHELCDRYSSQGSHRTQSLTRKVGKVSYRILSVFIF